MKSEKITLRPSRAALYHPDSHPNSRSESANLNTLEPMKTMKNSSSIRFAKGAALAVGLAAGVASPLHALTFSVNTVSIAPTGAANLQNNKLIVRTTPWATIEGYIATGSSIPGLASWDGFGINSSTASTENTTQGLYLVGIGVLPNDFGFVTGGVNNGTPYKASYGGVGSLVSTDTLAGYTYMGDSNLDGLIDGGDYNFIDTGFAFASTGYFNGDYNFDGVIDGGDYNIIDTNYIFQGAPIPFADGGSKPSASIVPEPGAVGLALLGGLGLLNRRRRNSQN